MNNKELLKFCILLKNEIIKDEIDDYLIGYSLDNIKLSNGKLECNFFDKNNNNNNIKMLLSTREINLYKYEGNILSYVVINENTIKQIDIEKRENGIVCKEIQKAFRISKRFKNKTVLVDLVEDSYVFSKDKINKIINNKDFNDITLSCLLVIIKQISMENELKNVCDLYNNFSTHMNHYYYTLEGGRKIKDNIYPTRTYLNGEDVSNIFDISDDSDKLYRVYDLYKGIINPRNENDINLINSGFLSSDAFDFRTFKGITEKEDNIAGKSVKENSNEYISYLSKFFNDKFGYKGEIKTDREGLLNVITYKMSWIELAKRIVERQLGIPYEEFERLDVDDQHKLIEQKTGKKFKYDYRLWIDGIPMDKDHIITREQLDKQIDNMIKQRPNKILKRIFRKK